MPFTSQFALSLELSRLVPLGLVTSKAAELVMKLARDLQNSGSDIVIEEDMVNLFGRGRIPAQFASSFKTAVKKSSSNKLCEGIDLQTGAGPTVVRGLQQLPYFSMVVQCSLLAFCHDKWSLAEVLHQIFEIQLEEAPQNTQIRESPSQEGIAGFLEACANQTAEFGWWRLLEAVQRSLHGDADEKESIPPAILRSAIQMFAMVQTLPEDRMILINTHKGIDILVVWAHHVLGLTVYVKLALENGNKIQETRFGDGPAQVVIEYPERGIIAPFPPSITMLETSNMDRPGMPREVLFKIVAEPEDNTLYATNLVPLKGLAKSILRFDKMVSEKHIALERHQCLLAAAYALRLSRHGVLKSQAFDTYSDSELSQDMEHETAAFSRRYFPDLVGLLTAVKVLCNDSSIKWTEIEEHERVNFVGDSTELVYSKFTQGLIEKIPAIESDVFHRNSDMTWAAIKHTISLLSVVMLAFSHVRDLQDCIDACFSADSQVVASCQLVNRFLNRPESTSELEIREDDFLEIVQRLSVGSYGSIEDEYIRSDALSAHGWTTFRSTLNCPDPDLVQPFSMCVRKGTPCRNGIYRRAVVQGPVSPDLACSDWLLEHEAGDNIALQCISIVRFGNPMIGDRRECFIVNLRLEHEVGGLNRQRRTGFKELEYALLYAQKTMLCGHPSKKGYKLELPAGFGSFSEFGEGDEKAPAHRVALIMTAHNCASRWRALIAIAQKKERPVLLRGADCCFDCVCVQAAALSTPCFVVL